MMQVRLQKILADAGLGSRRFCEQLIQKGQILLNGQTVQTLGVKIDPCRDLVTYLGRNIVIEEKMYYAVNKPTGYVCTNSDPQGRKCVIDLIKRSSIRLYTVGRLDIQSEGLLFLTNDGAFTQAIIGPRSHMMKRYRVKISRRLKQQEINLLKSSMTVNGITYRPMRLIQQQHEPNDTWVVLELVEGKNRQIRKIFKYFGITVNKLMRIKIGPVHLGDLRTGEYRALRKSEIDYFKNR